IDVRVATAVTHLDDERLTYRGHDAAVLATTATFEQVAELLWTGDLPPDPVVWPVDRSALATCASVVRSAGSLDPIATLTLAAIALADGAAVDDAPAAARRLLGVVPSTL